MRKFRRISGNAKRLSCIFFFFILVCGLFISSVSAYDISKQVSASDEDADSRMDGAFYSSTDGTIYFYGGTTFYSSGSYCGGFVFKDITVSKGDIIYNAEFKFYCADSDTHNYRWHFEDIDSSLDFTDNANINARTRTTAYTEQSQTWSLGWHTVDVTAPANEVVQRAGWASGNNMTVLMFEADGTSQQVRTYDTSSYYGTYLYIDHASPPSLDWTNRSGNVSGVDFSICDYDSDYDCNNDGWVTDQDKALMAEHYGGSCAPDCCDCDHDGDGDIDFLDISWWSGDVVRNGYDIQFYIDYIGADYDFYVNFTQDGGSTWDSYYEAEADSNNQSVNLMAEGSEYPYLDDVSWYLEVYDDSGWYTFPNATARDGVLDGHNVWNFTLMNFALSGITPTPANGSTIHYLPNATACQRDICVNITGAYNGSVNVTFEVAYNGSCDVWGGDFCDDDQPAYWYPVETVQTTVDCDGETVCTQLPIAGMPFYQGMHYYWRVNITNDTSYWNYPTSGYWLNTSYDEDAYAWTFDISDVAIDEPTVAITYPVDGETYTRSEWDLDHYLRYAVTSIASPLLDSSIIITDEWGNVVKTYLYEYMSPYEDPCNAVVKFVQTETLDLSDYIGLECNFTINISARNMHCCPQTGYAEVTFRIADDPHSGGDFHLSVRNPCVDNNQYNATYMIGQPFTLEICTNESGYIFYYIADENGKTYCNNFLNTFGTETTWYNTYPINNPVYHTFSTTSKFFQKDHIYTIYVGIRKSLEGDTIYTDLCYDDEMVEVPKFSYKTSGFIKDYSILETWDEGYDSVGFKLTFGTFEEGVDPFGEGGSSDLYEDTGSDWGDTMNDNVEDATGIPYAGVIIALIIIAGCGIMPIVITKSVPPLPIEAMFLSFGFIVAFSAGFLPLWVFALIFLFLLLFIFYKIWGWAKEKGIISGAYDIYDRTMGKYGEAFGKTYEPIARKVVGRGKKLYRSRRRLLKDTGTGHTGTGRDIGKRQPSYKGRE